MELRFLSQSREYRCDRVSTLLSAKERGGAALPRPFVILATPAGRGSGLRPIGPRIKARPLLSLASPLDALAVIHQAKSAGRIASAI
jgi:hypothetical protein